MNPRARTPVAVIIRYSDTPDESLVGLAFTRLGVIRHVGIDPDTSAHTYQGYGWRVVVRGRRDALERIGAVERSGLVLVDDEGKIIAPCEITDRKDG